MYSDDLRTLLLIDLVKGSPFELPLFHLSPNTPLELGRSPVSHLLSYLSSPLFSPFLLL